MDRAIDDLHVRRAALQAKADALSLVFNQVAPDIPLIHVPVVRAHVRFGGRGNLRTWLLKTLEAAYPRELDTEALYRGAVLAFGLNFHSKAAMTRFRKSSLGRALRKALADGDVDRLEDRSACRGGAPGIWRWRPPAISLDELRAIAHEGPD